MINNVIWITVLLTSLSLRECTKINRNDFPKDFVFGTATSAYQVEGAWNKSGKGENFWDRFTHKNPHLIIDGTNGDIACDSYHKIKEDVALLKHLGVTFYRFSLSWSRILPKGFDYKINADGIRYYNELIDTLLENNITPLITLFHWDAPQTLHDLGGVANELFIEWFADYARVAFQHFGDRVKWWLTINEPYRVCVRGYGEHPPGFNSPGIGTYLCGHNLLKAHARVYHLYNQTYKQTQHGSISIALDSRWYFPKTSSKDDIDAAERFLQFELGWFAKPIFHLEGDYSQVMKTFIGERSRKEGFKRSRLPDFTEKEIDYIKGTYDFFGLNHYTTRWVVNTEDELLGDPSFSKDMRLKDGYDEDWPSGGPSWFRVKPDGFRNLLKWVKDSYGDLAIYVIENGYSDVGQFDDQGRINYYKLYLSALLDAIYTDKVNVKGYTAWSLLDNFEWLDGYVYRFGIYYVDHNDPERKRTPKASVGYLKKIFAKRRLL